MHNKSCILMMESWKYREKNYNYSAQFCSGSRGISDLPFVYGVNNNACCDHEARQCVLVMTLNRSLDHSAIVIRRVRAFDSEHMRVDQTSYSMQYLR